MAEDYLIDRQREEARRRLDLLETLDDPGTFQHLEAIGVAEGWRCLEIGAGGGSVASWLCRRVGSRGRVVATDLETRFLDELEHQNLEVRRHNLASDALESNEYDLVHARSVLMHLPQRDAALGSLVRAARPGGWVLLEEPDSSFDAPDLASPKASQALYRRVTDAIYRFVRDRGVDPTFGGGLYGRLRALGLQELRGEGRLHFFRGGAEPRSPHMPAFAEIRDLVVGQGRVSAEEYDDFLALAEDPEFTWREPMLISVFGRRAG